MKFSAFFVLLHERKKKIDDFLTNGRQEMEREFVIRFPLMNLFSSNCENNGYAN